MSEPTQDYTIQHTSLSSSSDGEEELQGSSQIPPLESVDSSRKRPRSPSSPPMSFSEDDDDDDDGDDTNHPSRSSSSTTSTAGKGSETGVPNASSSSSSDLPPAKRIAVEDGNGGSKPKPVDTKAFFQNAPADAGPQPSATSFQSAGGGTKCLAIICGRTDHQSFTSTETGSTFNTCKVRVILGQPDLGKSIEYDETNDMMVFTIPDPHELEAAKQEKKRTGAKTLGKITKYEDHRIKLGVSHFISVKDKKTLPGIRVGTIAWVEGLRCGSSISKDGRIFYQLSALELYPVEAIGANPSRICEFLRRTWPAEKLWYHETPFVTEEEIKNGASRAGEKPMVIPICGIDNSEKLSEYFSVANEKGFFAATRNTTSDAKKFFYLPKSVSDEIVERQKTDPSVVLPDPGLACLSDCKEFFIKATLEFVIQQWDTSKSKTMEGALTDPDLRRHYEVMLTAMNTSGLEFLGATDPRQWAILWHHIPLMGGVALWVEDRAVTGKRQDNLNRHSLMERARSTRGPDDPRALGLGVQMRQFPGAFCRGLVFNMIEYLERYALRCDFATASMLMGAREGDAEDPKRLISLPQRYGEETVTVYRPNNVKIEVPVKLNKDPDGFVGLHMTQKFDGNMRTLHNEYTKDGIYYVLLPTEIEGKILAPADDETDERVKANGKLVRHQYAQSAAKWIPKIQSAEVYHICTEGASSIEAFNALKQEWAKADPEKEPSKYAAGQWLSYHKLVDCPPGPASTVTPYLVYALEKPQSPEIEARRQKTLDDCVRAWFQGPTGVQEQKRPGYTIRNPIPTDSDKAMEDAF